MYTLRFPFRLPAGQSIEVKETQFDVGNLRWSLVRQNDWFVAKIEGFGSEAEAQAYVTTVWTALKWVQIHAGLAIEATLNINNVIYAADPEKAASNLAKSFGLPIEGRADGLVDGSAASIYPTEKKIFTITGGDARVTMITAAERVIELLREGVQFPNRAIFLDDAKLRVAIDLYAAHFSETSINARFLTLVMALEALTKGEKRPKTVLDLLARWGKELDEQKAESKGDLECLAALESLGRELVFRRESSIRNQIRSLVKTTLTEAGDADAEAVAKKALKIYDHRSTLVHDGTLDPLLLSDSFSEARSIVERVLRARVQNARM
jgi:hypothetical protein